MPVNKAEYTSEIILRMNKAMRVEITELNAVIVDQAKTILELKGGDKK